MRADTERALAKLAEIGVEPTLWRTPYGVTAPFSETTASEIVGWTVDTHDWRGDTAEDMLKATGEGIADGAIVLVHDGIGPGAQRCDVHETLRYVELVTALATLASPGRR